MTPQIALALSVLFLIACSSVHVYFEWRKSKSFMNACGDIKEMRRQHMEVRREKAKEAAAKLSEKVLDGCRCIRSTGKYLTEDRDVAMWFKAKGYDVKEPDRDAFLTSRYYTIKLPEMTPKELSDTMFS